LQYPFSGLIEFLAYCIQDQLAWMAGERNPDSFHLQDGIYARYLP
jgi:hypothetical protein